MIGVDVGGTKILAGVLDLDGAVLERREVPTPTDSQDALLDRLVDSVRALPQEAVQAVGFGLPSRMSRRSRNGGAALDAGRETCSC